MGILNDAAMLLTQLPLERWISKGPKHTEHWERLEKALKAGEEPRPEEGIEPAHSFNAPETSDLPPLGPNLGRATETPRGLATTEETVAELKGRLAREIYRFQLDLTAGCKIAGKPCDCCDKHPSLGLAALCEELLPMDPTNPLYREIPDWYKRNAHKLSLEGSASGKYDAEYPLMAAEMRVFRKGLLGTETLTATAAHKQEAAAPKRGNPGRVSFHRGNIDSAINAAKRLKSESDLFIYATGQGFTIGKERPPFRQQHIIVKPDGTVETIKPSFLAEKTESAESAESARLTGLTRARFGSAVTKMEEGATIDEVVKAGVINVSEAEDLLPVYQRILANRHLLGLDTSAKVKEAVIREVTGEPPAAADARLIPLAPRRRELGPEELEFFADSMEQVSDSMDRNGLRNEVASAFQEAIAKAKVGPA